MSCVLSVSNNSVLEDLTIADIMSDPLLQDNEDSSPSSGNLSESTEEGDSSSTSESPLIIVGKDCDNDKDSGIEFCGEDSLQPLDGLTPPDKELVQGIIDMVEFYFSDANLLKDTFLLKHVRRNKEGYVSLKLITNFRKVKTFTRDWRIVAYSLKHSKQMQVNDQCTKVRRRLPLPSYDETQPSRTVLITGLPSVASVDGGALELVSRFGDLVLVRLIKSTDSVSSSEQHKDLKKFFSRRPDLEGSSCVLVEFARQESAARAVKEINAESSNYCAYSLSDKTPAPVTSKTQPTALNSNNNVSNKNNKLESTKKVRKGSKKQQAHQVKAPDSSDSEHQYSPEVRRRSSGSISSGYVSSSPRYTDFFERRSNGRSMSLSNSQHSAPVVRPRTRLDTAPASTSNLSVEASPWVQRRIAARSQTQPCVVVIREPRGPDGSKGFQQRRLVACS